MAVESGPKPETMTNGAAEPEAPRKSLREVAEAAYDEVESGIGPDDGGEGSQQPVDDGGQKRDEYGRFKSKDEETGEAAPQEPSPDETSAPQSERPTQPQPGEAAGPPANWSNADREMFAKAPPEMQAWALRRHSEMEGDYQKRVQTIGEAARFTEALSPIFQEPVLGGHLRQTGIGPYEAIQQWAGMHRRALHPDPRERVNLLVEMARGMGLDPAALFVTSRQGPPPGLSEADAKDPAIRYFADHLGRTSSEVQALRNQVQGFVQGQQRAAEEQQLRVTRWGIDSFAEQKDEQGNPLHPHFDSVLPQIIELFKANPGRDLREAYETALWMAPDTRQTQLAAAEKQRQAKQANERAAQAVRSNARGRTVPVTGKPPADPNAKRSLRDVIEAAADEVGF